MKHDEEEKEYLIPDRLNLIIVLICSFFYFLFFRLASLESNVYWVFIFACLFGVMMIPVYTLIHEAEHNILNSNLKLNNFLGRWLCCLFIAPFTFFKHCHFRHHKKNRTDIEIWELYQEHQIKWKRYGNLYGMMIGFGYWAIVLSVIFFATLPRLVYSRFFLQHTEIAGFLEGSETKDKIRYSQWESLLVIIFQIILVLIFRLNFQTWILFYLVHGFIWSSQNYVNHAFSPREIINGAHNLKIPLWLKPIYLNFNLHLAHHQNPKIPWIHLPDFVKRGTHRISFFKNYLRLWRGPKLTQEPDPAKTLVHESLDL